MNASRRSGLAWAVCLGLAAAAPGAAVGQAPPDLVFGGNESSPPFEYLDSNRQPQGFNVELVRALAKIAGKTVAVRLGVWKEVVAELRADQVQLVAMGYADARAQEYDYLAEIWTLRQAAFFPRGRAVYPTGIDGMSGEIVAVQERSIVHELFLSLPEATRPLLRTAPNHLRAAQILLQGDATVVAGNSLVLREALESTGVTNAVEVPIKAASYQLATAKARREDFAWIAPALERLKQTGEYSRLVERHLAVRSPESGWPAYGRYAGIVLSVGGLAYLGATLWNRSLRQQVDARTRQLTSTLSLLQATLESTADGILVVDKRGAIASYNRRFVEMWGIPADALASGQDDRVVASVLGQLRDPDAFVAKLEHLYAHPDEESEDILEFADGRVFERYSRPQRIDGESVGRVWSFHDVTAHRRAEDALRKSEERYALAERATSDVIWDWDPGTERAIWSPALSTVFGHPLPAGELPGSWWEERLHPADRERVVRSFQALLEGRGLLLTEEYRFQRADGSYADVVDRAIVVRDARQRPLRMIGAITDISPRKQAEAERERLIADLAAKNAELERFSYTVSHDLKSPLVTIRGYLDLLERSVAGGKMEQFRTDLARIVGASEKMRQLLDDLLELSRIGRVVNPPEDVSLHELTEEAIELVSGRLQARRARVEIAADLGVVRGDRRRLLEVLQNLIDNAAKFASDEREPSIAVAARTEGARRVFYVQDNGIGIEPRHRERVFGLFEKLETKSEGTGIGLALVRRIVEAHGGRIWVESSDSGSGVSFCFTLNEVATASPASESAAP